MKYPYLILVLLVSGCSFGQMTNHESQQKESKKEATTAVANNTLISERPTPLISTGDIAEGGVVTLTIEGPLPREGSTSSSDKMAMDSSLWSMSFTDMWSSYSAFFYLILVGAAWLAWWLVKSITKSKEFAVVSGAVSSIVSVGSMITEKLVNINKTDPEWAALSELQSKISKEESLLRTKSNPKG